MTNTTTQEDIKWVDDHYPDLHEKYPGKYIVVKNGKVIVAAETHEKAFERANEILGENIEFIVERIEEGGLFAYNANVSIKKNHE